MPWQIKGMKLFGNCQPWEDSGWIDVGNTEPTFTNRPAFFFPSFGCPYVQPQVNGQDILGSPFGFIQGSEQKRFIEDYDCVNGQCVLSTVYNTPGLYKSLAECEAECGGETCNGICIESQEYSQIVANLNEANSGLS